MRIFVSLRPLVATTLLFAAACGGSGPPASDAGNEAAINDTLGNADEAMPESVNQTGEGVNLVSLPPAPADVPAAEAAPLSQAAAISSEIDSGAGVERVPFEGGWAWRRDGRILRTASRDGRRVSWFRPGENTPFLVQQGDETFAYAGGRPQRAFDRRGRPAAVTPQRQEEARRLADQSRRDRDQAERTPRHPASANGGQSGGDDHSGRARNDDHEASSGASDRNTATRPDCSDRRPAAARDPRCGRRDRDHRSRSDNGNRQ